MIRGINCLFTQALRSRNLILHSAKMELSDEEVNEHIENMIDVLKECPQLNATQEASIAIQKLIKVIVLQITLNSSKGESEKVLSASLLIYT